MTTREEYAEAAQHLTYCGVNDNGVDELFMLAALVMYALSDGAVLCRLEQGFGQQHYVPLEPKL